MNLSSHCRVFRTLQIFRGPCPGLSCQNTRLGSTLSRLGNKCLKLESLSIFKTKECRDVLELTKSYTTRSYVFQQTPLLEWIRVRYVKFSMKQTLLVTTQQKPQAGELDPGGTVSWLISLRNAIGDGRGHFFIEACSCTASCGAAVGVLGKKQTIQKCLLVM